MYNSIKSSEDIQYFLENVNSLHDGYIIGVQYVNNGISKIYKAVKSDGTNSVIKHLRLPIDSNRAMELVNRGKISTVNDSINYYVNVMNQEINILSALNSSPYILRMYDAIQNNNGNQSDFYIIMENAVDINQYFANNGFSESDVVKLGIDICSALEACKGINVIHNDIKLSNIFYDGYNFKLGDFGSSTYGSDNNLVYFGTPNYLSPEVCFKYIIYHRNKLVVKVLQ